MGWGAGPGTPALRPWRDFPCCSDPHAAPGRWRIDGLLRSEKTHFCPLSSKEGLTWAPIVLVYLSRDVMGFVMGLLPC